MQKRPTIHFTPTGEETSVEPGTTILTAGTPFAYFLEATCGGEGTCGKCKVHVIEGDLGIDSAEEYFLTPEELAEGVRLACRRRIDHATKVRLLDEGDNSRAKLRAVAGDEIRVPVETGIMACYLSPEELAPSPNDFRPLWTRIAGLLPQPMRSLSVAPDLFPSLSPGLLTSGVTLIAIDDEIVAAEHGDTCGNRYGVAIDIGTTTIACYLVDLSDGTTIGASATTNPQRAWGGDVMSRINYAMTEHNGLTNLRTRVIEAINRIITEAVSEVGVPISRIDRITLVGNSAMHHFFFGIDPSSLGLAPYLPVVNDGISFRPRVHGLDLPSHTRGYFLPCIAGFVGADTVGVMLAADLDKRERMTLALDIGTNGETMLGSRHGIVCGSNAAGPAFEGAKIRQGMRAIPGAIGKVEISDGDVHVGIVGTIPARGICGSGLIDAIAELRKVGIIDPTGRILAPDELNGRTRDDLAKRIVEGGNGNDFILVKAEDAYKGREVCLTQPDVREVQLAGGAIAAGRKVLACEMDIEEQEIAEVLLAGAFGNYIRPQSAVRVGLIPNLPPGRIHFIGNAAGRGARLALISQEYKRQAERLKEEAQFIEFAGRLDFQEFFIDAMIFPEVEYKG